ncbi:MAG: transcriptional regulator [Proteobacteria bacterium]|nr:transcriptional regulator [Pseudomonadota bacterium]MDE3208653.1 transcriptional regulator [Pseudomonadota bacterium]
MGKSSERSINPKDIRQRLGFNQQEFWNKIGVTQSGGSRYESGRPIPKPVKELFRLVYIERIDLAQICREDHEIMDYLKRFRPDLLHILRQEIKQAKSSMKK